MLDQIPPEVVTRICEHARRTDLYSVLQVSQTCHKLAAAVLYRSISLSLEDLQPEVTRWTKLLDRTKLWKAPRCITVANPYDVLLAESPSSSETPSSPGTTPEPVLDLPVSNELGKDASPRLIIPSMESEDPIRSGDKILQERTRSRPQPCQTDSEVFFLTAFLRKLSSLGTLIWYSDAAPAPSLALLLRNELSACEIHLRAFSVPYSADLEHMQSLVTLPNLRSIWFQHTPQNGLQDVLQSVVKCHKSGLEEVRMLHGFNGAVPFRDASPNSWNDQDCEGLDQDQLGRLCSLQLVGYERDLQSWARCTDFSYLRHLSLGWKATRSSLEILLALRLSLLDSLALDLDYDDTSDQYYTILRTFLCSIRPLFRLRLKGSCEASHLKSILDHHGVALRTLYLVPCGRRSIFSFTPSTIALVTETCKDVAELGITMRRYWNKPGEDIAVLDAIGRLPYLSDLHLTFDASGSYLGKYLTMDAVVQSDYGPGRHIRDAFINSAIDADLAKAVFNTVVSVAMSNSSIYPSDSFLKTSRLRCMSLAAEGGGHVGTGAFDSRLGNVIMEVEKRWNVERPSLDCDANLEAWQDKVEGYIRKPAKYMSSNIEPVFRSIWPDRGGYWFNEWHAFPLKS